MLSHLENWVDPFKPPPAEKGAHADAQTVEQHRIPATGFAFIWYFARQSKSLFVAMLVFSGLASLVEVWMFAELGRLIDLLETTPKNALLRTHGSWFLAMLALVLVGRTVSLAAITLIEQQAMVPGFFNRVRWQSHRQVQRQSLRFFQNDFAGRVAQKVMTSGMATGDLIVNLMQNIWLFSIYVVASLIALAGLDWQLGAIFSFWIFAFALIARVYVPRVRKGARETAELSSMVTGRIVDSYTNAQTVKLFSTPDREDAFVRAGMEAFIAGIKRFTRTLAIMRISLTAANSGLVAVVGAACISLWLSDQLTLGAITFALGLMLRLTTLSTRMLGQFNALFRNFGTMQNSAEMIGRRNDLQDQPDAVELTVPRGEVVFEAVRFRYERDQSEAVGDVSLTIKPGERVGIVGPSGAGKTTLVNLLLRFFDPDGGAIRIDGQATQGVTQTSLRQNIGVVTQDSSLLNRSIFDNIAFGRPDATRQEVEAAARQAEAHEFIEGLCDHKGRSGYDAHVGERGVKLSGGQRQRIALARVLLKNAPILVLDEATSALDSEVEAVIQARLHDLMAGKTVIAIAHRLSTIAALDRLIILNNGKIVESGSHSDLLKSGGLYATLWHRQSGGFIAADDPTILSPQI